MSETSEIDAVVEGARTVQRPSHIPRVGELVPFFRAAALHGNPNYKFDTAAGRHMLMLFFGTASHPATSGALDVIAANRSLFNDLDACFFGVTCDAADEATGRIAQQLPGIRFFLDYDGNVSRLFGAMSDQQPAGHYQPFWLLLDRQLRVVGSFEIGAGEQAVAALRHAVANISDNVWAPVIEVPHVFEPELCRQLIDIYEAHGGEESGFMREVDGKTVLINDPAHKRRSDCLIVDPQITKPIQQRIFHRLIPSIHRAFQFEATRMERYIVACYDGESGGYFRPHRDNTTRGTAHRRFAVTINLNADEYEGGDLRFPEFGPRTYRAPTGGAVVFSCSLLHEAMPVISGKRYAFLPFLYDEAGAQLREQNNEFLSDDLGQYRK